MQIGRYPDESLYDYHKRIVYGKLVDKTLSDIDYTELAMCLYGRSYSSDVARRMFYGSKRTIDVIEEEKKNIFKSCISDDNTDYVNEVFDEMDRKSIELQKEKQKYLDQRREFNKLVREEGRAEHLYEELIKAANALPKLSRVDVSNDISDYNSLECDAVLVFSDWHYGMKVSNGYNVYDTDICRRRVDKIVSDTIKRLQLHHCSNLHIVVLGDLIHGAIHNSARVASEELVCDQLMNVSEILANAINGLRSYVDEIHIYMTYGNHARTVQNKNDSIHADNMEKIIPWWLKQRFNECHNEDIYIHNCFDDEIINLSVMGHDICASHGDLDNVKNSPRLLTTLLHKTRGINLEYIILGDKHHIETFNELGVTSTICGALCGVDDYANDKRLYSDPSQLLLIVNENGVDAEYRLKC